MLKLFGKKLDLQENIVIYIGFLTPKKKKKKTHTHTLNNNTNKEVSFGLRVGIPWVQDEGFVGAEVVKVKLLQALAAPAGPPAK